MLSQKKVKVKINSKNIIFKENYNFCKVFSKKNSNILFFYYKYNYKILLKKY